MKVEPEIPSDEASFGDLVPFGDPAWYADFRSPYYNDTHRRVRSIVRDFTEKEIMPVRLATLVSFLSQHCHEWDEAKQVPISLYSKCAANGILAMIVGSPVPKEYHGPIIGGLKESEIDPFHEFIVCDELSRCGSGGVLWGLIGGECVNSLLNVSGIFS